MNKGNCKNCGHKIQATLFDKCMYCGAELPPAQKFSELEKEEIRRKQKLMSKNNKKQSKNQLPGLGIGPSWGDCEGNDS